MNEPIPPESNVTDNLVGYEGDPEDPTPVYESDLAARQDDDPEPRGSALVWPMQFGESAKVPFA